MVIRKGGEFRVNTFTGNSQFDADIAGLAGGSFVVTWTSINQDGDDLGVFGQRYDDMGIAQGPEFRGNSTTVHKQDSSVVTGLEGGGFVVTWASAGQDGSLWGVFGQRFDADGLALGDEFQVNSETRHGQREPAVSALPGGGFVVAWGSGKQDGDRWRVFGQRFDADGVPTGANSGQIPKLKMFSSIPRLPLVRMVVLSLRGSR